MVDSRKRDLLSPHVCVGIVSDICYYSLTIYTCSVSYTLDFKSPEIVSGGSILVEDPELVHATLEGQMNAPQGFYFRDIVEDDIPQVLEIANHMILHTTSIWRSVCDTLEERKEWLQKTKSAGYPAIGLFDTSNDQMAGWASSGAFRVGDGYKFTTECAIGFKQEYMRRGLGHFLLQHLIQVLRDSGFQVVIACISSTNQTSARFFSREGFSKTGHLPGVGFKHGQTLDLEIWQLDLRAGLAGDGMHGGTET